MRKTPSVALALGMSLLSIWALGASGPVGAAPPMHAAAATVPGSVWAQQPSGTHETLAGVTCPSAGTPRLVASNTQLAVDGIGRLSFSADGRTLAVVADQGRVADTLAVDVATGRAAPLLRTVDNVDDVQFSPVSPRLAYRATVYVPVAGQPNTVEADEAVYVADPQGRHGAMLTRTTLSTSIQSLAWSPDGRNVAYLWGGGPHQVLDEIRAVDVATRHARTLVGAAPHRQFTGLAWMRCRV